MLRVHIIYRPLGAATRYRVGHQMEQVRLAGLSVSGMLLDDLGRFSALPACDLLYLYRIPLTSRTLPLLLQARLRRIPIVFDSDDLVWDVRERAYNFLDNHYSPQMVADILRAARRTNALMRWADAFVFSTPFLADYAARSFRQPAFVHQNALGEEQVATAERAFLQKQPHHNCVVIGYFCGTPRVHDEDLASITSALAIVLAHCPTARLRIYGEVALSPVLQRAFADRIERRPAISWHELPEHIAAIDINIAPLIDNPQRRAKSAVKYLEAALLRVPTVASRLNPYQHDIVDGVTGLLADSEASWANALLRLVHDAMLRQQLGLAAYRTVVAKDTTAARAAAFGDLLEAIASQR